MLSLYLVALLAGGGLLALSLFGGDHDGGDDLADAGGADVHDGGHALKFLSLRTLTYFLFVFGGIGAGLRWVWDGRSPWVTLLLAVTVGASVAAAVAASFSWLRRTDSGGRNGEDTFVGLAGRVVLPFAADGLGKVQVHRGNRTYELLARPHAAAAERLSDGRPIVVVAMERGTALVAPLDDPILIENP